MAKYGYQYETSPRKLEPEYPKVKRPKKKPLAKKKKKVKAKKKRKMSFEAKFFVNSMLFFAIIFAMIFCQALVNQKYKEKEKLKQEYSQLVTNSMVANSKNDDTRRIASDYGMQTKSATLIDLGTTDYIESSTDQVEIKESFWDKIINWLKNIW